MTDHTASIAPSTPNGGFTIGAVSHITGIPVGTLRVWERRYGGALPHRSENNRRQYTQAEVTRLILIRQLVESGHPVSSVARLTTVELQQRLAFHAQEQSAVAQSAVPALPRVVIYGETLVFALQPDQAGWGDIELHAGFAEFEKAVRAAPPDVLVAEWLSVTLDNLRALADLMKQSAVGRCILVYGYASREVLAQAGRWGLVALQAPVSPEALAAACRVFRQDLPLHGAGSEGQGSEVPPRQFSNEALVHWSRQSANMACECPRHLSELVMKLSAFEAYSLDCEAQDRANRERHQVLHRITADARALMESALVYLLQEEGLSGHGGAG